MDDDAAATSMVARHLANRGFEVMCAEEREEAEALLANLDFAVAVVDLKLTAAHGAEGLEVISFISHHCRDTRTVLLTGNASDSVRREAERRGADRVLEKPCPLAELASVVQDLAAGSPS